MVRCRFPTMHLLPWARAVSRVHDWRAPAALNETTTLYFQQQALIETDPLLRAAMEALTAATPGSPEFLRADQLLSTEPHYSAVLRSASSLTMLNGGFRSNVIPSSGTAVFNLRVLPGGDVDEIVSEMNRVGAEPSVKFVLDGSPRISPPPSPVDTELFRAMAETAEVMVPGVVGCALHVDRRNRRSCVALNRDPHLRDSADPHASRR